MKNTFGKRIKFRRDNFSSAHARSNLIFLLGSLAREDNRTKGPLSPDNRSIEEVRKNTGEIFNRIQSMFQEINGSIIEPLETGAETALNKAIDPGIERHEQVSTFPLLSNEELEKHKERILAVARATNAKARESQEKYAYTRAALEAVTEQYRAAEKRLQEVDELRGKYKLLEARIAWEIEMRLSAEQKLQAMVDELNIDLDIDWSALETNLAKAISA